MAKSLLDKELRELDGQMLRLGRLAGDALAGALEALATGNQDRAGAVVVSDTAIDDLHLAIEEHTFRTLTLQQPLIGRDLRYLTSLVPIAIDLERIGDEAGAIAQNVLRMVPFRATEQATSADGGASAQFPEPSIVQAILEFGQKVRTLLEETMKAFADRDAEAARHLWQEDKLMDRRSYVVRRDVMALLEGAHAIPTIQHDSHLLQRAICLLWIAHELERVADHCTNICERIVFIVKGETDINPPPEL